MLNLIAERLRVIRQRLGAAARRAGRDPATVTLIGVAKGQPVAALREAIAAGLAQLGENYVQEWAQHRAALSGAAERGSRPEVNWHFIGHLQTNKARRLVGQATLIHTLDSPRLADELEKRAAAAGLVQPVLIELNVAGEANKAGLPPDELPAFLDALNGLSHLEARGLTVLPPAAPEAEAVRPWFRAVRELRDALNRKNVYRQALTELSMGMSGDFEVAIEEGATLVRIGTALFGERS